MSGARIVPGAGRPETWTAEQCHIAEWWNDPGDEALSVARARVEKGVTTRLHRLHGISERYIILEGRGRVRVGSQTIDTVRPGDVVYIPPLAAQQITNIGSSDLVFLAVCTPRFTPDAYEDIDVDEG